MLKSFYNGGQKMAKKKKGSLWKEFKSFISRGNVLDMAVGVVIGGAFSAIVNATVKILLSVCTLNNYKIIFYMSVCTAVLFK